MTNATRNTNKEATSLVNHFRQGLKCLQGLDYAGAAAAYTRIIESSLFNETALINRGLARLGLGDRDAALADFKMVLRFKRGDFDPAINRGEPSRRS